MLQILAFIVVIVVAVAIIKAVGGALLRFFGRILKFLGTVIWLILFGPSALFERIIFHVTRVLHIQGPVYLLLGICAPWYYLFAHLPYSFKEMCIKEKEFFRTKKAERFRAIGMAASLFLTAVLLIVFTEEEPIGKATIASFVDEYSFYLVSSFLYSVYKMITWIRANRIPYKNYVAWKKWTKEKAPHFVDTEVQEKVESLVSNFSVPSGKGRKTFTTYNMVYGRATAFLSYFGRNTETDEPLLFSPYMSPSEEELREYGILISDRGIYISQYEKDDIEIPFGGLWRVIPMRQADSSSLESLTMDYGLDDTVQLESSKDYDLGQILALLKAVMAEGIPLAFLRGQVATELEELLREPEKRAATEAAQQQFDMQRNLSDIGKAAEMGGIGAGLEGNKVTYNAVKRNFDGKQGHGTAAEYANNAKDKLFFGSAAKHLGSDNKKGGADRSLFGRQIQSKYGKTARKSVNDAFEGADGVYKYYEKLPNGDLKLDAKGRKIPQLLEVPRDQYKEAKDILQQKIDNGQVEGVRNAKDILKKGWPTYKAALNIAGSESLESITVDFMDGIGNARTGASISALITFATSIWNGENVEEAARQSSLVMLKTTGKNAVIHTITMQLSRGKVVVNPRHGIKKSAEKYSENYIATGARKVAKKINSSSLAKSNMGKKLGLDKIDDKKLISGTMTTIVVFGPDVCRAFQGKISGAQLTKNALVNAAGLAGSALGSVVPVIGTVAVGSTFSFVAKKLLDKFIEDDAVKMFRIVREEFLDLVMLFSFSKEEFDGIVSQTLAREDMPKILLNMYQSGEPEEYIRVILNSAIQETLGRRKKITNEMYVQGMQELLLEAEGA